MSTPASNGGGRWQDWGSLALGTWLFISLFIGIDATNDIAAWNSYVAGVVVAAFSVFVALRCAGRATLEPDHCGDIDCHRGWMVRL